MTGHGSICYRILILRYGLSLSIAISTFSGSATPILFDFESGNETNPTFTVDGLTSTFSATAPLIAQRVSDSRSLPFAGTVSMQLSSQGMGIMLTAARVDFSALLRSVSLCAIDVGDFDHDFKISALSSSDSLLGTFDVTSNAYTQVHFSGIANIAAFSFSANNVNVAYWDNLLVTPVVVPAPSTLSFFLLLSVGLLLLQLKRLV